MENTALQEIMKRSGRAVTECTCRECRSQCKTPCLGTPDDILRIIQAGHIDKLSLTFWVVGMKLGKIPFPIPMVQATRTENGCAFFREGLCRLHDSGLKPAEGKLSHHNIRLENFIFELSLTWNVAKEWLEVYNRTKVLRIFALLEYYNRVVS